MGCPRTTPRNPKLIRSTQLIRPILRIRQNRRHPVRRRLRNRRATAPLDDVKPLRWWERVAGRLEYELSALHDAGIVATVDEELLTSEDRLVLDAEVCLGDERVHVRVEFPDVYPYTRFEVYADDLNLEHHQNPVAKNLCLINSDTSQWRTTDTVAAFLTERLPLVLQSARSTDREERAELEAHQAEPSTVFLPYELESVVLVDSRWEIPADTNEGWLDLIAENGAGPLRAGVVRVLAANEQLLAETDWGQAIRAPRPLRGRWIRIGSGIRPHDVKALRAEIARRPPKFQRELFTMLSRTDVDIVGFLLQEEVTWDDSDDAWFFVKTVKGNGGHKRGSFVRASRGGAEDFRERVPELQGLDQATVAVIGLGGIGGPSAIEFARAGVGELILVEHDFIEAATGVRWPLGLEYAGRQKAAALKEFLGRNYPHVTVQAIDRRVGGMPAKTERRDDELLRSLMNDCDLIYDATAERGLTHLFSDMTRSAGVPYVCVSTTPGAWGGLLVRMRPGKTAGCHYCLMAAMQAGLIPSPPLKEDGTVQPRGCASPTFTGAGFDVAEMALHGVRLAMSTLAEDSKVLSYPSVGWDVGVVGFRDQQGNLARSFQTYPLERHETCKLHD